MSAAKKKIDVAPRTLRRLTRIGLLQKKVLLEMASRPDTKTLYARLSRTIGADGWLKDLSVRQRESLQYFILGVHGAAVLLQQELGAVPSHEPPIDLEVEHLLKLGGPSPVAPTARRELPAPAPVARESAAAPRMPSAPPKDGADGHATSGQGWLRGLLLEAAKLDAAGVPIPIPGSGEGRTG